MKKVFVFTIILLQISLSVFGKNDTDEFAVGTGKTQIDAIINSIDNVLSQKYSSWSTAMTNIINDEIADGKNIASTDPNAVVTRFEITSLEQTDGNMAGDWIVKAKIKTGKSSLLLKQLKQNISSIAGKPAMPDQSADLLREFKERQFKVGQQLDKKALAAIVNICRAEKETSLLQQLTSLLEYYQTDMFDYDVKVKKGDNHAVKVNVTVTKNQNTYNMAGLVSAFLYASAHAIYNNPSEMIQRASTSFGASPYELKFDADDYHFYQSYGIGYELYHPDAVRLSRAVSTILTSGIFGFKIVDNLGTERYVTVSPEGQLDKVGNFNLSPEYKANLPLYCGLGNTRILIHSFKYITESNKVIELDFDIPYSPDEYARLEDIEIVPFNQNLTDTWNKATSKSTRMTD